jgi:hypothetical protein
MLSYMCKAFFVLAALCCAAGCARAVGNGAPAKASAKGPVRVELSSAAKEYVLAQPIHLTLVVTNQRDTPMRFRKVHIDRGEPLLLYVSTDENEFVPREDGLSLIPNYGHRVDTLQPGASREYRIRIVYSWRAADKLTFPRPGRYWIRLEFPLLILGEGPAKTANLPSNAVEVRITEPTGVDATMFSVLRQEPFLKFLLTKDERYGTVKKALDLVKAHPTSSYHADLKASLEGYYHGLSMNHVRANPEWKAVMEDLRQWLKIPRPEELPFPEDKRLDVKFTYAFESGATIRDVFRQVSQLTKVPLAIALPSADLTMYGAYRDEELRAFMRNFDHSDRQWLRDGEGYRLVPKPAEKPKPAEGSQ